MSGTETKKIYVRSDEMITEVLALMRRLAVDGVAPRREQYNVARGEELPATQTLQSWGYGWPALIELAGLYATEEEREMVELDEYIRRQRAAAHRRRMSEWPMQAIPTRRRVLSSQVIDEDERGFWVEVRYEQYASLR